MNKGKTKIINKQQDPFAYGMQYGEADAGNAIGLADENDKRILAQEK